MIILSTSQEKLEYLQDTKTAIQTAIEEKGVEVPETTTFREYAIKISSITGLPEGGSDGIWTPAIAVWG